MSQVTLTKRSLLSFLNLMHMLVIRMMRVTLLDPEFWHILTWQKQSVSCCSGHLTFSCVYLRRPLEERIYPDRIDQLDFIHLIQKFIHDQNQPDSDSSASSSRSSDLPEFHAKISVYTSAVATFYAPRRTLHCPTRSAGFRWIPPDSNGLVTWTFSV